MPKYSLRTLAREQGVKRTARAIMPPIEERRATVLAYRTALRALLREIAREVRTSVIPAYRVDRLTRDADETTFSRLRALRDVLIATASATVRRILGLEAQRHTSEFVNVVKRTIGIDVSAIVRNEDLADYLRQAAARSTSLITGLTDDTLKRIEQTVLRNSIAGNSVATLREDLRRDFGIEDRRAQLIARDQTATMVSELNRVRQEQAGITKYIWSTSQDERVRGDPDGKYPKARYSHFHLDGKEYEWGKPTGAENGDPPGIPINCRCVARAVVEF